MARTKFMSSSRRESGRIARSKKSAWVSWIRAGLESVAYQTHDLMEAFVADSGTRPDILRVDGGMVANGWFLQFLSDILNMPVERPVVAETTALGAAFLAGLGAGVYKNLADVKTFWHLDKAFVPAMDDAVRDDLLKGWAEAISRIKTRLPSKAGRSVP